MKLAPGLTFSWKRAIGITAAKRKIARATRIPTSRQGRRAKLGRESKSKDRAKDATADGERPAAKRGGKGDNKGDTPAADIAKEAAIEGIKPDAASADAPKGGERGEGRRKGEGRKKAKEAE